MGKKLYSVRVLLYVMAENASEACVEATRAQFDIFECTARRADHLHAGWEDAMPYNSDDDRTCAEVLADERAVEAPIHLLTTAGPTETSLRVHLQPAAVPSSLH